VLSLSDAREPVAVISHRLWMDAFGGKPAAIGQAMSLDRSFYTIVGVAPESFTGTEVLPVDVWMPLEVATVLRGLGDRLTDRRAIWLQAIGRLAPDTSIGTATSEAAVLFGRLDSREPGRRTAIQIARASRLDTFGLLHSHEAPVVVGTGAVAAAMMMALLLICGSNAAALLLARGASRQKEIALRLALGAGRARVAQQLLAEVIVITAITAVVGAVVSAGSLRALAIWLPPIDALAPLTLVPEPRLLLFSSVFAAVVAFFFGLAPLRQTLQVDCLSNLKGDASMWAGPVPAARLRRALVATQVAVSVILLVAASLLGRAVSRSLDVDPGYVTKNLFIVQPDASQRSVAASPPAEATSLRVRDLMQAAPGIESVGAVAIAPYFGAGTNSARTDGMVSSVAVHFNEADAHYFEALGVRPIRGRVFRPDDPGVAVVNARLARMFWGSEDAAIGRALEIGVAGYAASTTSVRVVGVIPSIQTSTPGVPDEPTYYVPLTGQRASSAFLVVRTREGTRLPEVATAVTHSVDADAVTTVTPVGARLVAMTMPARIGAVVAGLIGVLALLVSAVGIHGIVAHAVTARIRDIGVHVALGAPRLGILRLVLGWTMRGVAIGLVAGVALVTIGALAFPAGLRAALFGLNPLDPTALSLAGGFLIGVTLVAALLPARRALGMAPLTALRHD
jgi:predicted permease